MKFRYFRKILSDIIFFPLVIFCIWNSSLVVYGLRMAKGQVTIVMESRDVKVVLLDSTVSDSVKIKLKLIAQIREFAFDSIGLKRNENYTTFFDQHGKRLIYVVTACEPFALEPHLWHFPVLGNVPYKGFFDLEKAKIENTNLKSQGFDTNIGGASGWSTLGFLKDPILSQMLKNDEGDLAEIIIHELTHGTIFVKDNVEFNENLARFIGYQGAVWFLMNKYGKDSKQLKYYLDGRKDNETLEEFMLTCAHSLDSLYKKYPPTANSIYKMDLKKKMFHSFVENSKQLELDADSLFPKRFEIAINKSGNAFFMQYVRYGSKQHDFETDFEKYDGDLRKYVEAMKKLYSSL
ncbi:MAG: aminopeptidase [Bacteroidetes bacterium]|nr:aminopeptidase [Bacteroidota bacterium]